MFPLLPTQNITRDTGGRSVDFRNGCENEQQTK
jgi:hypothetical protein